MHKILSSLFVVSLFLFACPLQAQTSETARLAAAIRRIKSGTNGNLVWRECGFRLSDEEAIARASEYASYLMEEHVADADFDPWMGAAIIMQESSFNRCEISRSARQTLEAHLGRRVREADIVRLLRNGTFRARIGVTAFDAGLAQFRWPGAMATVAGMTDPGTLVNARISIRMLASAMRYYRRACRSTTRYQGTHMVNRDDGTFRTLRYSISCENGCWVQHNRPRSFNYNYYRNVMRWNRELLLAPPQEEEDSL